MQPRSGGDVVSHRMDDHSSSPFAVPAPDFDEVENASRRPPRTAEPRAAPRSRAAHRGRGLWLGLSVVLAAAAARPPPPAGPRAAPRSRAAHRGRGLWLVLSVLLAGAGAGLLVWRSDRGEPPQTVRSRSSGPQPVGTAPVETADMPVILNALG